MNAMNAMNNGHCNQPRLLQFCVYAALLLGSACTSDSKPAANPSDASTRDATTAAHDAGSQGADSGSPAVVEDDASIALSPGHAQQVCTGLCSLRVPHASCVSDCEQQWPTLTASCRQVASDLSVCASSAKSTACMPVVQCCYNEAGRFGDICPLSFQQ